MRSGNEFLRLGDDIFLKRLEFPAAYDRAADELYRVDLLGFEALAACDGTRRAAELGFPEEFLSFCISEGILVGSAKPRKTDVPIGSNAMPSLRYLMVEVTDRCNLSCIHCYLGDTEGVDLPLSLIESMATEFETLGGLRFLVTGGEPLLHPEFAGINGLMRQRAFRSVLITNGTLLDDCAAGDLSFDEVQVSLDGMEEGHDCVRGEGSFRRAVAGIECLGRAGKRVSVATMVHRQNLGELDALERVVREAGAISWTLDVPCLAGRMTLEERHLLPRLEEAVKELERAFGSEQHEPSGDWTCGAHLACVKAGGMLVKCGFYDDWTGGRADEGLREAWLRMPRMKITELDCDCEHLEECAGGCRYRAESAGGRKSPDPLKCRQFGVTERG